MEVHPTKEVLAAHALGALPDDDGERASVEAHLDACARCRAQLREFEYAAAQLVTDVTTNGHGTGDVDVDLAALERAWAEVRKRLNR